MTSPPNSSGPNNLSGSTQLDSDTGSRQLGPRQLGMMGKFWESGQVKTRLGATIGLDQSASVYQHFIEHLCRQLDQTADHRELVLAPAEKISAAKEQLAAWKTTGWLVSAQADGDLGNRMQVWFESKLRAAPNSETEASPPAGSAMLIGGDCPLLTQARVDFAFDRTQQHDIVLGPSVDGGYYLIALRGPWKAEFSELFTNMQWSQSDVLEKTLSRAEQAGLSLTLLDQDEDVDTIEELNKLSAKIDSRLNEQPELARLAQVIRQAISGDEDATQPSIAQREPSS